MVEKKQCDVGTKNPRRLLTVRIRLGSGPAGALPMYRQTVHAYPRAGFFCGYTWA